MEYLRSFIQKPPSITIYIDKNSHRLFKYPNEEKILIEYPTFYINDIIKGYNNRIKSK